MSQAIIRQVEKKFLKDKAPELRVGDTVDVHARIVEGEKQRVQVFTGILIARRGSGINENFTVRRIVGKEGVERTFMVHSPHVLKVVSKRKGKVRRAKLFYLRDRVGKARRLREIRTSRSRKAGAASSKPGSDSGSESELVAAG